MADRHNAKASTNGGKDAAQGRMPSQQKSPQLSKSPSAGPFCSHTSAGQPQQRTPDGIPQLQMGMQMQHSDASDQEQYVDGTQPQHQQRAQHAQNAQQPAYRGQQEQQATWLAAAPQQSHWGGGVRQMDATLKHQQGAAQYSPAPSIPEQLPQPAPAQMMAAAACATEPLVSHPRYRKLANLNKCAPVSMGCTF